MHAPPDQHPIGSTREELQESWKDVRRRVRDTPTYSDKNCRLVIELTRDQSPLDQIWGEHGEEELRKAKAGEGGHTRKELKWGSVYCREWLSSRLDLAIPVTDSSGKFLGHAEKRCVDQGLPLEVALHVTVELQG